MQAELQKIASQFALESAITAIDSLGEGFINDTFIVRTEGDAPDYILQRKNKNIFPDVPAMMENIRKVTDHIRRGVVAEGGDPRREVMTIVPTHDGKYWFVDSQGDYWAVSVFMVLVRLNCLSESQSYGKKRIVATRFCKKARLSRGKTGFGDSSYRGFRVSGCNWSAL